MGGKKIQQQICIVDTTHFQKKKLMVSNREKNREKNIVSFHWVFSEIANVLEKRKMLARWQCCCTTHFSIFPPREAT